MVNVRSGPNFATIGFAQDALVRVRHSAAQRTIAAPSLLGCLWDEALRTIPNVLPLLTGRSARQRLEVYARVEGHHNRTCAVPASESRNRVSWASWSIPGTLAVPQQLRHTVTVQPGAGSRTVAGRGRRLTTWRRRWRGARPGSTAGAGR
ncbi:hypothetical protein Asi03nite_68240 [Actinoplanes siamensis]|uniref:Uncharacterized protein n=1 Tax=Actinoplanes siamensis TaxID=1223317 RepID=A0A919NE95_9ACTN|nr:hypothetical protein Asi03nite_68240 [Actinoplanes siamensis]